MSACCSLSKLDQAAGREDPGYDAALDPDAKEWKDELEYDQYVSKIYYVETALDKFRTAAQDAGQAKDPVLEEMAMELQPLVFAADKKDEVVVRMSYAQIEHMYKTCLHMVAEEDVKKRRAAGLQ